MPKIKHFRSCPCYQCLCMPICRGKQSFQTLKDDCKILYQYLYCHETLEEPTYKLQRLEICKRLVSTCEQFNKPLWKSSLVSFLKHQHDLEYVSIFRCVILEQLYGKSYEEILENIVEEDIDEDRRS